MSIPILLVAGFLGAGKTTLVNRLLRDPGGRRIAAVVNDFGAIDVDAALLGPSTDGIVSLRNGCICCSLQGDLLRTLSTLLRRRPAPGAVVIETSGASDPAEIVRALLDPVIHAEMPLDTVATLVDARHLADRPNLLADPLWRSQLAAADLCIVAKSDLVDEAELRAVRDGLARLKPPSLTFEAVGGDLPSAALFGIGDHAPAASRTGRPTAAADRFESASWTSPAPLSLARFQAAVGALAPRLLRAKGFVAFDHDPSRPMLFQLVGTRASLVASDVPPEGGLAVRLVLIAERGRLDLREAAERLDASVSPGTVAG